MLIPTVDKRNDSKDGFYDELVCVLDQFTKNHTKMLLWDFSSGVGREDISKLTIRNESLHEANDDYTM